MPFMLAGLAFFAAAGAQPPVTASGAQPPVKSSGAEPPVKSSGAEPPCRAAAEGRALDFWLGDWVVQSADGATHFGDNSVVMAQGGCAVLEHWRSAAGGEGRSLFAFDARAKTWEQLWVGADTSRAGGLKRKILTGPVGAGVRFQGEIAGDDGAYLDRTTLTPEGDGRVRQLIEISTDGGDTWRATFDGYYAKAPAE